MALPTTTSISFQKKRIQHLINYPPSRKMAEISTSVNQFTYQHFQGFKLLHLLFSFHLFVLRDSVIGGSLQLITPHIFPCFFNGLNILGVFIVITRLALVSGRYKTKMNFKTENIQMGTESIQYKTGSLHTFWCMQKGSGGSRKNHIPLSENSDYFGKDIFAHLKEKFRHFPPPSPPPKKTTH